MADAPINMGRTATRGAAMLGAAQAVRLVTTLLSAIFVARLLTPSDYGVAAMVAPIAGFILIFQSFGLNQAIVQREHLSDRQINGIFWLNAIASLVIALLFVLLAPLVGLFYNDPRAAALMAASGLTVLATGISSQHAALLNRRMRFAALSAIDVVSAVAGLAFTIGFAFWLRSYWALFLGALAGAILGSIVAWTLERWRPTWRADLSATSELLAFGADVTGFNLLNFLCRNLDNLLIARWWGAGQLGLYDRSYRLMLFPLQMLNQPLARVMLPALGHARADPAAFRRMYLLAVRALVLAIVPGAVTLSVCSGMVVVMLLGPQWHMAGPIFAWLGLAAAFQPVSNATGWLFISTGRTRPMMRWGVIAAVLTIVSFAIGLPWGATGVAMAYAVSEIVRIPLLYRMATRDTPVAAADLYAVLLPSLLGGGLSAVAIRLCEGMVDPLLLLGGGLLLSYSAATLLQVLTPGGRAALLQLTRLLRDAAGRRGGAAIATS